MFDIFDVVGDTLKILSQLAISGIHQHTPTCNDHSRSPTHTHPIFLFTHLLYLPSYEAALVACCFLTGISSMSAGVRAFENTIRVWQSIPVMYLNVVTGNCLRIRISREVLLFFHFLFLVEYPTPWHGTRKKAETKENMLKLFLLHLLAGLLL